MAEETKENRRPKKPLSGSTSKYVHDAAAKRQRGEALTGNERRRLSGFALPAVTNSYQAAGKEAAAFNNSLQPQGRDSLEPTTSGDDGPNYRADIDDLYDITSNLETDVDALEADMADAQFDIGALQVRATDLEDVALYEGYTYEEFTICDSGAPASRWIPTYTSDPEA